MSGGGGGSNSRQIEKQYEYDINRWQFNWQEMQDNYEHKKDAYDIQIWNQNQNIDFKEQMATDEWNHKLAMRDFDYNNQIAAYNASIESYEKQLDFNSLAHEITANDNTRKFNERLTSIGFQNEELFVKLNNSVEDFGLTAKELSNAKKAKEAEIGAKSQQMGLKALQQTGAAANAGQAGRSARKNMQSIMAAFGQQQALLTDTLEREGASMGLKWDKQNAQLGRVLDSTELGQRQLRESMKSANAQWESDNQNAALQKYSADINAEAAIAPEPQLPPLSPAPLKYPRPKSLAPQQPPSWEQYESVKPIKGAISKPSALQKAAGIIGTVASVAAMFPSDDRLKYDINKVGTSKKGIPIYTFRYRTDGKHGPKYIGTSAQDLLAMGRKDAVAQIEKDGFYSVDYSKLDVNMEVVTT
tara:strand:- start:25 stop:1269 length:1245 start_codon:yes stop_codon:yes gene_type:complete